MVCPAVVGGVAWGCRGAAGRAPPCGGLHATQEYGVMGASYEDGYLWKLSGLRSFAYGRPQESLRRENPGGIVRVDHALGVLRDDPEPCDGFSARPAPLLIVIPPAAVLGHRPRRRNRPTHSAPTESPPVSEQTGRRHPLRRHPLPVAGCSSLVATEDPSAGGAQGEVRRAGRLRTASATDPRRGRAVVHYLDVSSVVRWLPARGAILHVLTDDTLDLSPMRLPDETVGNWV